LYVLQVTVTCAIALAPTPIGWLDAAGALFISFVILATWVPEAVRTEALLSGRAPDKAQLHDVVLTVHWAAEHVLFAHATSEDNGDSPPHGQGLREDSDDFDLSPRLLESSGEWFPCRHISSIAVYHYGVNLIVEVDIFVPSGFTACMVSQATRRLRCLLEKEADIERCFVSTEVSAS
jgi:hypothetical protein